MVALYVVVGRAIVNNPKKDSRLLEGGVYIYLTKNRQGIKKKSDEDNRKHNGEVKKISVVLNICITEKLILSKVAFCLR